MPRPRSATSPTSIGSVVTHGKSLPARPVDDPRRVVPRCAKVCREALTTPTVNRLLRRPPDLLEVARRQGVGKRPVELHVGVVIWVERFREQALVLRVAHLLRKGNDPRASIRVLLLGARKQSRDLLALKSELLDLSRGGVALDQRPRQIVTTQGTSTLMESLQAPAQTLYVVAESSERRSKRLHALAASRDRARVEAHARRALAPEDLPCLVDDGVRELAPIEIAVDVGGRASERVAEHRPREVLWRQMIERSRIIGLQLDRGSLDELLLAEIFSEGSTAPRSRRQDLRQLTDTISGWAIDTPAWLSTLKAA